MSLLLTLRHLQEIEVERERDRCTSLSPPHPLSEEFSLYQKLWDWLDYRKKVDKSDTNIFMVNGTFLKGLLF